MRDLAKRGALEREAARRSAPVEVFQLDATDPASIARVLSAVNSSCGPLYGLVNNAGIQLRGYFEDLGDDEIRRVFEVNVFGTMAVTRAVLSQMRAARQGRIVITTSIGGRIGSLGLSAYCASKFALEGFGESLNQELAPLSIHVALVEPAIVRTEIWAANRNVARGARDRHSPYFDWFSQFERLTDWAVRSSPTSSVDVAAAIHRALTDRQPRLRYTVGRRAGAVLALRRILPDALFKRLYFAWLLRYVTRARGKVLP